MKVFWQSNYVVRETYKHKTQQVSRIHLLTFTLQVIVSGTQVNALQFSADDNFDDEPETFEIEAPRQTTEHEVVASPTGDFD